LPCQEGKRGNVSSNGVEEQRMADDITIISCGTLKEDLERLKDEGLLEGVNIVFTEPCLKERSRELERQLTEAIVEAGAEPGKILVLYGDRCFIDMTNLERDIDAMIAEAGQDCERLGRHSCVELMLSEEEKAEGAADRKVYWLMPAWVENKDDVFFEWDIGKRNQTFPQNDTALMVDSRGYFTKLMEEEPEKLLEFSDWMGIPMEGCEIDLDRFRSLLLERIARMRGEPGEGRYPS
jgi:hypothetical protein